MKKSVYLFFLILAINLIVLLSACASKSNVESAVGKDSNDFYNKLKDKGVIEVGATPTGPPFTFLNSETNEIDGLMVDIVRKIGEELDLKININSVQWASLIPSVEAEKIDMIAAGMSITKEREKVLGFSAPVYSYGESIVVLKDNNKIKSLKDLKGKKVGVQEASIYYNEVLKHPDINIQTYKTHQDMSKELKSGRIDAFFADYPIFKSMLRELPELKTQMKIVSKNEQGWNANIAVGMPREAKGLQKEVNEVIEKMKENGELNELLKKWDLLE